MLYLNLPGHDTILKKRFGISPEKHSLTAMPYRLFQGNLQNWQNRDTIIFFFFLFYAPELVTLVVAIH